MLNLPSEPGTTGLALLALGALLAVLVLKPLLGRVAAETGAAPREASSRLVAGALALTLAGTPFTLWRVVEDIRRTAPITPEHALYVGAETKGIDGALVERVAARIPRDATYGVVVSERAYRDVRESLSYWLGYALVPRRQARDARAAAWIVTWGATPSSLGIRARPPQLVGRNRLADREPVYVSRAAP